MQVHGARQMSLVRQVHAAKCVTTTLTRKVSPERDTFATAQRNTYLRILARYCGAGSAGRYVRLS